MEIKHSDEFNILPWENPAEFYDKTIKDGEQHYAKFERYGIFVINDQDFRTGDGSRVYIFTPDKDAINTVEKVISTLQNSDVEFRDKTINAGLAKIEDQSFPLPSFQSYKCEAIKVQGPNELLVDIISELQNLQLLPEHLYMH